MPNKRKGLTKAQMDKMKAFLLERQHRLHEGLRGQIDGDDIGDTDRRGDEADLATQSLRDDINVDVRARESREVQLIEQALRKIDEGIYGNCEDCGEAISVARLEALPFAQFCIDCQERNEAEGVSPERREFQVLD